MGLELPVLFQVRNKTKIPQRPGNLKNIERGHIWHSTVWLDHAPQIIQRPLIASFDIGREIRGRGRADTYGTITLL